MKEKITIKELISALVVMIVLILLIIKSYITKRI